MPETAYVLVHPETFPSIDWDVDDETYGRAVLAAAATATIRLAILDSDAMTNSADGEDLTVGVGPNGWALVELEPHHLPTKTLAAVSPHLPAGTPVTLGGYHRDDCVATVARLLASAGHPVTIDEPTTLPYPGQVPFGFWE